MGIVTPGSSSLGINSDCPVARRCQSAPSEMEDGSRTSCSCESTVGELPVQAQGLSGSLQQLQQAGAVIDTPLHRHTDVPLHRHSDVPLHRHTDVSLHRHTDAPLHRHTDVPLHRCTAAPLHRCTAAPLHRCTAAPLHRCTAAPLHRCTTHAVSPPSHASSHRSIRPAAPLALSLCPPPPSRSPWTPPLATARACEAPSQTRRPTPPAVHAAGRGRVRRAPPIAAGRAAPRGSHRARTRSTGARNSRRGCSRRR